MSEKIQKVIKYVVRRSGYRVSDKIWDTEDDALNEFNYWNSIINRISDGTTVTIEPFEIKDDYNIS